MLGTAGCGKEKHRLTFDSDGFSSKKTEYAAGEKVTVIFDWRYIGTDTDYRFYSDDVTFEQDFEPQKGYIFTFTMPDHDVTLHEESRNSMIYDPPLEYTDAAIEGISILKADITDFYYTYDWSGYNALYQRYRFYAEEGKYLFYHETRSIENDYGWASEADITASGTISLSIYDWDEFLYYLTDGSAVDPEEAVLDGDSGPWMYLYYKSGDKTERKEFHFASAEQQTEFESFCQSLVQRQADK